MTLMSNQNSMVSFSSASGALVVLCIIYLVKYFIYSGNQINIVVGIASILGWVLLSSAARSGNMGGLIYLVIGGVACYTFFYEGAYLLISEFSDSSTANKALRILLIFLGYTIMSPLAKINPK